MEHIIIQFKRRVKSAFIVVLIDVLLLSCMVKESDKNKDSFEIFVSAQGFPDSAIVKLYNRDIDRNIDSTFVIDQNFILRGQVELPSLCYLNFYDRSGKGIDPYNYFYLGNEKVFVKGTYEDFFNAEVTGSAQTELLKKYKNISQSIKEKASQRIKETADSIEIEEIKRKAKNLIWEKENEFLFNYANNQMSLHQINYRKKRISKDSLMLFHKRLDSINSGSIIGKELLEYASTIDIQVGDKFRDISGFDLDGKKHSLSEYIGKVILLDFWATGCMPCRIQNKNEFQRIYNQFSEDDFVLMSYSMDTKQNSWKKSSENDSIKWINISDLKGLKSDNVKAYAVDAIPNSFLIDKNGIVVKSFIGYRKGEDKIFPEIERIIN